MERTDAELAPIIGQKLDDTMSHRLQSLRDYLGRLHAEQHCTQFFLYYLMKLVIGEEMPDAPVIPTAVSIPRSSAIHDPRPAITQLRKDVGCVSPTGKFARATDKQIRLKGPLFSL